MSNSSTGRPSILANLILMLLVGGMLVGFFYLMRGCEEKAGNARIVAVTEQKPQNGNPQQTSHAEPTKEEIARTVAEANQIRKTQPASKDAAEEERQRQLLEQGQGGKPFSTTPPGDPLKQVNANGGMAASNIPAPSVAVAVTDDDLPSPTPPSALPVSEEDTLPAKEPVREIQTNSAEGAALIKDASARIDEAPADLYSDKAKSKVREGLQNARRIFKIHTVYFEKGGSKPADKDVTELGQALTDENIAQVMDDPRAVFFVLGFADRTGDAATNKKLSKDRSNAVIDLLKTAGALNLTYPVAIGSTELVSPENQNKNRAAEVWLVLP